MFPLCLIDNADNKAFNLPVSCGRGPRPAIGNWNKYFGAPNLIIVKTMLLGQGGSGVGRG